MAKRHMKICWTMLITREMQIKTTVSDHLTPFRIAIIKKSTNNKCYPGCGEKGIFLHCWWECKLVQLLWRTVPHSSTLVWKIPWTEEPGRLQSMGSLGVGHDWATSLSLFTFMHWRRKWQPTPTFLPGESQGRGSLMGCRLWGRTELDTTEAT